MKLLEDGEHGEDGVPIHHSFNLGLNGNTDHSDGYDTSESESDMEEVEPVSATLVLRLVSEPTSPSISRKSSENQGETFLQVSYKAVNKVLRASIPGASTKTHLQHLPLRVKTTVLLSPTQHHTLQLPDRCRRTEQLSVQKIQDVLRRLQQGVIT